MISHMSSLNLIQFRSLNPENYGLIGPLKRGLKNWLNHVLPDFVKIWCASDTTWVQYLSMWSNPKPGVKMSRQRPSLWSVWISFQMHISAADREICIKFGGGHGPWSLRQRTMWYWKRLNGNNSAAHVWSCWNSMGLHRDESRERREGRRPHVGANCHLL